MPRMSMFIENINLPRVPIQPPVSNNVLTTQTRAVGLQTMSFKSPMIGRIANSRPSCGACGKH